MSERCECVCHNVGLLGFMCCPCTQKLFRSIGESGGNNVLLSQTNGEIADVMADFVKDELARAERELEGLRSQVRFKDGECFICKQNTSSVACNPHEWPFWLPYYGGNGKTRCYCWGCVIKAVHESEEVELEKLRDALRMIRKYAFVSDGQCKWEHNKTFADIVELAEAALEEKGSE